MRKTSALLLCAGLALGLMGFGTADAGVCPAGSEAVAVHGAVQCAHPDQDPVDSTRPMSNYTTEAEARALACFGSGTDGNRLQAVFVTEGAPTLDSADRSVITQGMINVQAVFRASSRAVSDIDVVPRWAHSADCEPSIEVVQVAPGTLERFASTIQALADQGHDRPDRKYIMWTDSSAYCGIAAVSIDESKVGNRNDGHHPGYARIDRSCWGYQGSVVTHEVTHTLGAVQPSAPNATPYGHCTDEYDVMCYADGQETSTRVACTDRRADLGLDCNNDDYFHPDPPPGSWLYSNWNVADSSFVERMTVQSDAPDDVSEVAVTGFVDVGIESPHVRAIGWLADRGITRGCETGRFCPEQPVTRGQMAAFLHRFAPSLEQTDSGTAFTDVAPDSPFASDIAWLVGTGLTRGCDQSSFCPDQPVSRGQMAAFLFRAFGGGAETGDSGFADVSADAPFGSEIAWLAATGISNGCGEGRFCSDAPVGRAQMASFLYRAWEAFLGD